MTSAPANASLDRPAIEASGPRAMPWRCIERAEPLQGAMEIDRAHRSRPRRSRRDHALALAEPVDAEKMRAVGIGGDRGDEPAGLAGGALVAEDRQAEGRLGDEEIAAPQLEGRSRSGRAPRL